MARIWGYQKGEGRYYRRKTGTKRFPDSGKIKSDGRSVGKEITGKHNYGVDVIKPKKKYSKRYKEHPFVSHGKKRYRGGYKRKLR